MPVQCPLRRLAPACCLHAHSLLGPDARCSRCLPALHILGPGSRSNAQLAPPWCLGGLSVTVCGSRIPPKRPARVRHRLRLVDGPLDASRWGPPARSLQSRNCAPQPQDLRVWRKP
eukprot:2733671-Rhodomonas_salina.3